MNKYQKALTYIEERHGIFLEGTEKSKESFYALEELIKKHEQLENAFNVACKLIYKYTGACPLLQQEFKFSHCKNCRNSCVDCWEKYCLKVVKNNKLTKK